MEMDFLNKLGVKDNRVINLDFNTRILELKRLLSAWSSPKYLIKDAFEASKGSLKEKNQGISVYYENIITQCLLLLTNEELEYITNNQFFINSKQSLPLTKIFSDINFKKEIEINDKNVLISLYKTTVPNLDFLEI